MKEHYFQISVSKVSQIQSGIVLLGKLKFIELLTMHRLTERKASLIDPFGAQKVALVKEDEEFQRQLSPNKINKLVNYLKENIDLLRSGNAIGLFPTSIILALDHNIDYDPAIINSKYLDEIYTPDLSSCLLNEDQTLLHIPKNTRIALIVDGQHRFYGVKKFYDDLLKEEKDKKKEEERKIIEKNIETIKSFEFVVTFLIGFDIYDVGKIFATVNFTQKPVNRSLYYDIFGSVPDTERNDIKLAHDLALHLNNSDKSPIQGMIKMLGKGYGLFSQAFFVEKMLIHFRSGGVWERIYSDYIRRGKEYKKIPIFMRIYLQCIKDKLEVAWPKRVRGVYSPRGYDYILCKTTGMGAIFRLIRDIYPLVKDLNEKSMNEQICTTFAKLSKQAESMFSKDGDFGGAGSEGLQVKLYKQLRKLLQL